MKTILCTKSRTPIINFKVLRKNKHRNKPPPEVFTGNTRDSSGVNPEGKAWGIYIWTVECITHKHWWGVVWLACTCTNAGIQIIIVAFVAFVVFSFLTKPECSTEQLLAADLPYCWLYPNKQAVDCFMVFVHLDRVLFSHLKHSVEQVLTADLSARTVGAGRLLIASMNNITGPTDTRTEPGYKWNCTWQGKIGGLSTE